MIHETVDVDYGYRQQSTTQAGKRTVLQQTPDYFYAIDLVAMYRRADKQRGARPLAPDYLNRDRQIIVGIHGRHAHINHLALTGFDADSTDSHFCVYYSQIRLLHVPGTG